MTRFSSSIVITTKNRKEELSKAIASCIKLKGNSEILIFDDGSEDGTMEFVQNNFPTVRVHREEKSLGLINARTKAASIVTGEIIFSIDDDACFSNENTVMDILPYFDLPEIAAVSIPYIDVLKSPEVKQPAMGTINETYLLPQYRGTAHALRKDIFLKLGGYRKNLIRQEEETDFGIRLFKEGYKIRVAKSDPILHYESPKRNYNIIAFYAARNNFLLAWVYTPWLLLIPNLLILTSGLIRYGIKNRTINSVFKGFLQGIKNFGNREVARDPLTFKQFLGYKRLRRAGFTRMNN